MKENLILLMGIFSFGITYAQVGINTDAPKATLHAVPQTTGATTTEGIIAPNLTRAQVIGKDAQYGTDQRGACIYVTTINGTSTTKTAQITAVGYYYFDGTVWIPFIQPSAIIPTEPWRVQGGTTSATTNTQNIYQTGSVAIGTGSSAVSTYKLDVNGSSNTSGNSRVGSSTVLGAQTIAGAATIASTGSFTLAGNGAAAGRYLASDATGKGTWTALPAAAVTTANNGLTMSGTTTQLGGALVKATTISGTAANTLTVSAPSIISGALRISSGTPAAGKFLTSDAAGNASWGTLPATATTEPWRVQGGTASATTNTQNIYQTGKVAIGVAQTAAALAQTLYVNGATHLQGATTIGTTASPANLTVSGNTALNGTTTAKATTVTGQLRYTGSIPSAGYVLTSDANGNAHWQLPGFSEFKQVPFARSQFTLNGQQYYYTGLFITFPRTGTYSVTLGTRLRVSQVLTDEPIIQLLPIGADTDPKKLWEAKTPRFAGSYEIMGIRRYNTTSTEVNKEFRFVFSENLTVTNETGLTVYLVMYLGSSAGANAIVTWGNDGPSTNGDNAQATGGSYVRIN